mmetsp:Transcript_8168/g.21356  ORF Transcript_8168/g.21356 Transcript_8168/m.21356 type:complete len:82 (+) Transcript_8168:168-413(+)
MQLVTRSTGSHIPNACEIPTQDCNVLGSHRARASTLQGFQDRRRQKACQLRVAVIVQVVMVVKVKLQARQEALALRFDEND